MSILNPLSLNKIVINSKQNSDERQEIARLVLASQNGDRAAFGELFQRYERHVFSVAMRRLGNFNDAQELAQEVFIKAMDKIAQLRQPECFGGWLRSITHRMAINMQIRQSRGVSTEPEYMEANCIDDASPDERLIESERDAQLHEGLGNLREMDRQTLEAFYVRGQSLNEMSDEFDAPLGTIKRRLHVARKRLAQEVAELVV
ncbi:sigma-70 family RNA polymerase sigma factor [Pirellulaceae bacterium]|nr:sigma-70 family RNA polymerase sigma factor [Pirellulaceae bacterium]